jgi:hypothetical protein
MLEIDPSRQMSDEVREKIIDLAKSKECDTVPGSRFKLKHNGTICTADAYGVQCMRIDTKLVDKMLMVAHDEAHMYVKNKLRKDKPTAYANAIRIQN